MTAQTYIFDIDGTLANCDHRLHFVKGKPRNYKTFYAGIPYDTPIAPMIELLERLHEAKNTILFCTGRPEETRAATVAWISANVSLSMGEETISRYLYMRPDGNYERDDIIKEVALDLMLRQGYKPDMVFDDRPRVCDMFKRRGILVARVGDHEAF